MGHVVEEQPACGETLCSVEDFKAYYQHIVDFDWDTECPMPELENTTSTTEAGINDGSTEAGKTNSEDNHHHHHEDTSGEEDSDEDDSDEDHSDEDHSDEEDSDEDDSSEEEKDKDDKKCHKKAKC